MVGRQDTGGKAKGQQFRDLEDMCIKWGAFDGIVTKEQWLEAWSKIQKRAKAGTKTNSAGNRSYLLKSVLHCGHCGKAMQGKYISKLKPHNRIQYRCTSRPSNCPECNGSVKENEVMAVVLAVVHEALGSLVSLRSKPRAKGPKQDADKALKGLNSQIEQTKRRMRLITSDEAYVDLVEQLTELRAEQKALENRSQKQQAPSKAREWQQWVNSQQLALLPDPDYKSDPRARAAAKASKVKPLASTASGGSLDSRRPGFIQTSIPEFQSKLAEMGVKVQCYFTDTGKRQGKWLLDKGKLTIEVADIAGECGTYFRPHIARCVQTSMQLWTQKLLQGKDLRRISRKCATLPHHIISARLATIIK